MLQEKQYTDIIDISSSGDNTIITAPTSTAAPGAYLAIDHINLIPTSAVSVTFYSGSNAVSGSYPLDAKQTIVLDNATQSQYGVINCGANEDFIIKLGGAVQVGGFVNYRICNY
jgi:hypothetical protein